MLADVLTDLTPAERAVAIELFYVLGRESAALRPETVEAVVSIAKISAARGRQAAEGELDMVETMWCLGCGEVRAECRCETSERPIGAEEEAEFFARVSSMSRFERIYMLDAIAPDMDALAEIVPHEILDLAAHFRSASLTYRAHLIDRLEARYCGVCGVAYGPTPSGDHECRTSDPPSESIH